MKKGSEILRFTEFETKYRTDDSKRFAFKKIMEDDLGLVQSHLSKMSFCNADGIRRPAKTSEK